MRKVFSKLTALLLTLALVTAMTAPALAEMEDLVIHQPAASSTYYRGHDYAHKVVVGETIPVYVETESLTADYLIKFTCKLCPKGTNTVVWTKNSGTPVEDLVDFTSSIPTKSIKAGTYRFDTYLYAHYNSEDNYLDNSTRRYCAVFIKNLGKPTNVKAVPGKRQVTVKWTKTAGATHYQIWRSTKKTSGYKRITTVKNVSSYVNKSLAKGAKYYYRVRAVRSAGRGKVYGPYSAITPLVTVK